MVAPRARALLWLGVVVGCGRAGFDPVSDALPSDGLPIEGAGPLAIDYGRSWAVLPHGDAIAPLSPSVVGTAERFSIEPELPAGITLDPDTGILAGTTPALLSATTYTVTVHGFGLTATTELRLDLRPRFEVDSVADDADANPGDGLCATAAAACTVRAAVEEGNLASPPIAVVVPAGTYLVAELQMSADIAVIGAGQDATILDGQLLNRVLKAGDGATVYVSDLQLRRGAASGGSGFEGFNASTVHLSNLKVTENTVANNGGAGLKFTTGAIGFVEYSTIAGNIGDADGGGMQVVNATATVYRTRFENNTAVSEGGALATFGGATTVTVASSYFGGNAATRGGAISTTYSSSLVVTNSTFVGNTAMVTGAVATTNFETPSVQFVHCTLVDSDSVPALRASAGTSITLRNTILATGSAVPCDGGTVASSGGNVAAMDATSCGMSTAANDRMEIDPMLVSDGASLFVPGTGSPALDSLVPGACGSTVDAKGLPRPLDGDADGDAACDVGAVELLLPR